MNPDNFCTRCKHDAFFRPRIVKTKKADKLYMSCRNCFKSNLMKIRIFDVRGYGGAETHHSQEFGNTAQTR